MSLFGCPTRRSKHAKGRDTDWLDAAVRTDENGSRFSLNGPRTRKVCVLQTYTAQLANELNVTKGEVVHLLHHAKHWAYVVNSEGTRGYIPYAFCRDPPANIGGRRAERGSSRSLQRDPSRQYGTAPQTANSSQPQLHAQLRDPVDSSGSCSSSSGTSGLDALDLADTISLRSSMDPEMGRRMGSGVSMANVLPFFKVPYGQSAVLFDYDSEDENDLSVCRGETVTILNQDDPSWVWVRSADRREGFVPRMYICPCGCTSIHEQIVESLQVTMAKQQDVHLRQQKRQRAAQKRAYIEHYTIAEKDPAQTQDSAELDGSFCRGGESDSVRYSVKQAARAYSQSNSVSHRQIQQTKPEGFSQAEEKQDGKVLPPGELQMIEKLSGYQPRNEQVKLMIQADYEARSKDELSIKRGQWVFTTDDYLKKSEDMEWLYVYTPGNQFRGYIPKNCASALA